MENNIKNNRTWKRLLLKYFDFNDSGKIDWWEIGIIILILFLFDTLCGIVANLITK